MKYTTVILVLVAMLGCDDSKTTTEGGDPDTTTDTGVGDTEDLEPSYGECVTDDDCDAGADPCGIPYCDLHSLLCMVQPPDSDGDGHLAMEVDGESCDGGTDCDDTDPGVHPGAIDAGCDWIDHDCDGVVDHMDDDGDGFGDTVCFEEDCDDTDPDIHPDAVEICDDLDQDCDETVLDAEGADDDGDGFLDETCGGDDCDDTDPEINPAMVDICDDIDNNCDTIADNASGLAEGIQVSETDTWGLERSGIQWSGSEYGVAWIDQRRGPKDIFFRRVSASGVMASTEIVVTDSGAQASYPSMTWTGSEYGIVWEDTRLSAGDVFFASVAADGTVLVEQQQVTSDFGDTRGPDIEWTGSEFGVAFADGRDTTHEDEIWFARLNLDGTKIGTEVMVTTGAIGSWALRPSLQWTGSTWGMAWTDDAMELQFALVDPDGALLYQEMVATDTDSMEGRPAIAWSGSEFGVAWFQFGPPELHSFARIGADGVKVGSDIELASGMMPLPGMTIHITWTSSEYGIFWTGFDEVTSSEALVMTRVAGDGTILMVPAPIVVPDSSPMFSMGFDAAFDGASSAIVAQETVGSSPDFYDQVMLYKFVECD